MQISEINYERKYAYAEAEAIINYMGDNFKNKLPKEILRKLRNDKRQGYIPPFDFSKPLVPQVTRQETKNLIAYLYLNYWCDNDEDKNKVLAQIEINKKVQEEENRQKRKEEIEKKMHEQPQSLDVALKARLNK